MAGQQATVYELNARTITALFSRYTINLPLLYISLQHTYTHTPCNNTISYLERNIPCDRMDLQTYIYILRRIQIAQPGKYIFHCGTD